MDSGGDPITRAEAVAAFRRVFGLMWRHYMLRFEGKFGEIPGDGSGWASCVSNFEQNVRAYYGMNYRESDGIKAAAARPGFEWVTACDHATAVLHTGSLVFFSKTVRKNTLEFIEPTGPSRSRLGRESLRIVVRGVDVTARRVAKVKEITDGR